MDEQYIIRKSTLDDVADAVRWRTGRVDEMSIAEMIEEMNQRYLVDTNVYINHDEPIVPWTRPNDWPDLDDFVQQYNFTMEGDDGWIVMLMDCRPYLSRENDSPQSQYSDRVYSYIVSTYNNTNYTIDRYYCNKDGSFSLQSSSNNNESATNYHTSLPTMSSFDLELQYPFVIHVFQGDFRNVSFKDTSTSTGYHRNRYLTPLVERIAYLPKMASSLYGNSSSYAWSTYYLQREVLNNGTGNSCTSLSNLYVNAQSLRSLDISGLKTHNVTSMTCMFQECFNLQELDLRHFDVKKVTSFSSMFYNCRHLKTLNLTGWNTNAVTALASMFYFCQHLQEILGIEDFKVDTVGSLSGLFQGCASLIELDLSKWNVMVCTSLSSTFNACYNLTKLDISTWNVSRVTNVNSTFSNCKNLKILDISNWTTGILTSCSSTFYNCHNLQKIVVTGFNVTSTCTSVYNLFSGCFSVKELDIPTTWDLTGIASGASSSTQIFYNCYSLKKITGIKNWHWTTACSITSLFANCYSLENLDVSGWIINSVNNVSSMFSGCYSLKTLNLTNWQPENSTTFASMFYNCYSLTSIGNIDNWDTSKSTTFASMFAYCYSLPQIPNITNWDMSKATTVSSMFDNCQSLQSITIKNLTLSNCTTIANMFRYCSGLTDATLTGWSIPKVTATAPNEFIARCYRLENLTIDIPFILNHTFIDDRMLTKQSVLNILNNLPTVSTSRTVTIPVAHTERLTDNEKAIATNKGWTIAN